MKTDYREINRLAWNNEVLLGNVWTTPASDEDIGAARKGDLRVKLTPCRTVPPEWLNELSSGGLRVLGLAAGGGQQCPVFAAAGNSVTVFDNSDSQLSQDRAAASKHRLDMKYEQGDMADLSRFPSGSFDVVFNPMSMCFTPSAEAVWKECSRVLGTGGLLLTGFMNPVLYIFDEKTVVKKGKLKVKYTVPYSDLKSLGKKELKRMIEAKDTLEFSHTLDELLGGITREGFVIESIYTDSSANETETSFVGDCFFAVRARKI